MFIADTLMKLKLEPGDEVVGTGMYRGELVVVTRLGHIYRVWKELV